MQLRVVRGVSVALDEVGEPRHPGETREVIRVEAVSSSSIVSRRGTT